MVQKTKADISPSCLYFHLYKHYQCTKAIPAVRLVFQTLCDFAPLQLFQTKLYDECNNCLFISV